VRCLVAHNLQLTTYNPQPTKRKNLFQIRRGCVGVLSVLLSILAGRLNCRSAGGN
jgi:hypothetical protein